ncbi:MAG: AbrB/MazE/SpoVT family DNA-binding domain-containing protein [Acidobacteriota bacterium]
MSLVKLSSNGQVTIPAEIRRELDLEAGDALLFEAVANDSAQFRVVRQRSLSDLAGSLASKRPYPGRSAEREETGRQLGREMTERLDSKA